MLISRYTSAAALTVLVFAAASGVRAAQPSTDPAARSEHQAWQCAPFARLFSGIEIFGDAWTWWEQAVGRYARGLTPETGAVLVFKPAGALSRGHVAVVDHVLTDRIIQVTHANWSPVDGHRGQIENEVTVVDVSQGGDWSQVKVWFKPSGALGTTIYPTFGFVYRGAAKAVAAAGPAAGAFDPASRAALSAQVQEALR